MFRYIITLLMFCCISFNAPAEEIVLKNSHPDRHVVGMIKLLNERIGLLMLFHVSNRVSYALVMQTFRTVNKLDSVSMPYLRLC